MAPGMEKWFGNSALEAYEAIHEGNESSLPVANKDEVQDCPGTHYSNLAASVVKPKTAAKSAASNKIYFVDAKISFAASA